MGKGSGMRMGWDLTRSCCLVVVGSYTYQKWRETLFGDITTTLDLFPEFANTAPQTPLQKPPYPNRCASDPTAGVRLQRASYASHSQGSRRNLISAKAPTSPATQIATHDPSCLIPTSPPDTSQMKRTLCLAATPHSLLDRHTHLLHLVPLLTK